MIKKVALTCICVFLAVVLIGAVVFPGYSFSYTVNQISLSFRPLYYALKYCSNFVSFLFVVSNDITDEDLLVSGPEYLGFNMTSFVNYHIDKYDLYERVSSDDFRYFFPEVHLQHSVAYLICDLEDKDSDGFFPRLGDLMPYGQPFLNIWYCPDCRKIVQIDYYAFLGIEQVLYSQYSNESVLDYKNIFGFSRIKCSNTFLVSEYFEYLSSVFG